jgi:glycine hydroxymethyltransferase
VSKANGIEPATASPEARHRFAEIQQEATTPGSPADRRRVELAAADHVRAMRSGLVLYAGTNRPLPGSRIAVEAQLAMQPSMGWPGEKLQAGVDHIEELEVLTARAVAAAMRARFADVRPPSATLANLAVYTALTAVGSTLAVLPPWAGGHASHHENGTAGVRGHRVVELPYDAEHHDVDLDALPRFLEREQPALIVLGGSLVLFPHRLREIAALASMPILYDASHTAGLIAGGRFQQPLAEGATVITFSTYKSFGGPPGGVALAQRADVAAAVASAIYPALTSNYDAGRLPALHAAATHLLAHGTRYADDCVRAARSLAHALAEAGFTLVGAERGLTESHHVGIVLRGPDEARQAVERLATCRIYASATTAPSPRGRVDALRLGTQEIVRRGLTAAEMPVIAELFEAALIKNTPPASILKSMRRLRLADIR